MFSSEFNHDLRVPAYNVTRTFRSTIETLTTEDSECMDLLNISRLVAKNKLAILYCSPGTTLNIPAGICGLWCPLRGELQISEGASRLSVTKRYLYVTDFNRQYDAVVSPAGKCIAILGTQSTWSSVNAFGANRQEVTPAIFPALHALRKATVKSIIALSRECFGTTNTSGSARPITALSNILNDLQSSFENLVDRCPGTTIGRRRGVFLRLQRARLHMELYNVAGLDVPSLAHIANYSTWQFIKIFRHVFGSTPYAYLSHYRIEVAKSLLVSPRSMGVSDIARAVGFSSISAFNRRIKQIGGASATRIHSRNTDDKKSTRV